MDVRCYADDTQLYLSMSTEETEQLGATKIFIGPGQGSSSGLVELTGLLEEHL